MYERKTAVEAVQFFEKDYMLDKSNYPSVCDKAMLSEFWSNKTVKDGRYCTQSHRSHFSLGESTTLQDGDYILKEELGVVYTLSKDVFEANYKLVRKD